MGMRELEKYTWLASVISILTLIHYQLLIFDMDNLYGDPEYIESTFSFSNWLPILVGYAHQVVSAFWLYHAARKESLSGPAWSIFGLSFGFIAVTVFYSANIFFLLKDTEKLKDSVNEKT